MAIPTIKGTTLRQLAEENKWNIDWARLNSSGNEDNNAYRKEVFDMVSQKYDPYGSRGQGALEFGETTTAVGSMSETGYDRMVNPFARFNGTDLSGQEQADLRSRLGVADDPSLRGVFARGRGAELFQGDRGLYNEYAADLGNLVYDPEWGFLPGEGGFQQGARVGQSFNNMQMWGPAAVLGIGGLLNALGVGAATATGAGASIGAPLETLVGATPNTLGTLTSATAPSITTAAATAAPELLTITAPAITGGGTGLSLGQFGTMAGLGGAAALTSGGNAAQGFNSGNATNPITSGTDISLLPPGGTGSGITGITQGGITGVGGATTSGLGAMFGGTPTGGNMNWLGDILGNASGIGSLLRAAGVGAGDTRNWRQSGSDEGRATIQELLGLLGGSNLQGQLARYSPENAVADAQGQVENIFNQYSRSTLPQIFQAGGNSGGYNSTTTQLLANDAFAQANTQAADAVLRNITNYAGIRNAQFDPLLRLLQIDSGGNFVGEGPTPANPQQSNDIASIVAGIGGAQFGGRSIFDRIGSWLGG